MEGLDYGVTLQDHMSGPAARAARSLSDLARKLGDAERATKSFAAQPGPLTEAKSAEQASKIAALSSRMAGLKDKMVDALKPPAAPTSWLEKGITDLTGKLTGMVPSLTTVAETALAMGAAFTVAAAGIIMSGAELAISATQTKDAIIDTFSALQGGATAGRATEGMLESLSHQIGITRDTLEPFAKKFAAMGVTGTAALEKVTLAAISAQAIMRDPAAGDAFVTLSKKIQVAAETGHGLKIPAKGLASLASMGVRVDDVAKRMGVSAHALSDQLKAGTVNAAAFGAALQDTLITKGAGPLDRMSKSAASLKASFGQNITEMFENLSGAVDPFLDRIQDMIGDFDKGGVTGKAMVDTVAEGFSFVFKTATEAITPTEALFLNLGIVSVQVATLTKSHWLLVQASFVGLQPILHEVAREFQVIEKALSMVIKADGAMKGLIGGKQAGNNATQGLIDALDKEKPHVENTGKGLGDAATAGVNKGLDNHSPSKKMFKAGVFGGVGLAGGIHSQTSNVAQASRKLGNATVSNVMRSGEYSPRRAAAGFGGRSAAPHGPIGPITIHVMGKDGVTNALELVETAVAVLFERYALHEGL